MSTEKTEAIVIRQADFSETSRVVTLFSRDFGKISVVAKGAKRLKGPFDAALDLLASSRIVFIRKSNDSLDILTEAQLISRFRPADNDLTRLYGGYYVAELLSSLTEDYDPHPTLYNDTIITLQRLAESPQPQQVLLRFELTLLREIGQLPAFDVCISCSSPVQNDAVYGYWVAQGGLICSECRQHEYESNLLQPGTVRLLRNFSEGSDETINRIVISTKQYQEMRAIVTSAISHTLGRRPKMFRYLQL